MRDIKIRGFQTLSGLAPKGETSDYVEEMLAVAGVEAVVVLGKDDTAVIYRQMKELDVKTQSMVNQIAQRPYPTP